MLANAFNKMNYKKNFVWKQLEINIVKNLHKLKPTMFADILTLFNKRLDKDYSTKERRSIFNEMDELNNSDINLNDKPLDANSTNQTAHNTDLSIIQPKSEGVYRGSWEFFNKIITILPVQIEKMTTTDVIKVMEVMIVQNIKPTKLLRYFIYPKFEKTAKKLNFQVYIRMLKVLGKMQYQEDKIFWKDFVLENIYNLDLNEKETQLLYDILVSVKLSCPEIEFTKYLTILEKLKETFVKLREKDLKTKEKESSDKDKNSLIIQPSKLVKEKVKDRRMRVERDFSISQVDFKSVSNVSNQKLKSLMKLKFDDINTNTKEGKLLNELKQNISTKVKEYEEVKLKEIAAQEDDTKIKERPKAKKTPKVKTNTTKTENKDETSSSVPAGETGDSNAAETVPTKQV